MPSQLRVDARARLREQVRREQELAAQVLAADAKLTAADRRRAAVIAAQDEVISNRRAEVADALANYLEQAGVGIARAAAVLDRNPQHLSRLLHERRARRSSPGG